LHAIRLIEPEPAADGVLGAADERKAVWIIASLCAFARRVMCAQNIFFAPKSYHE
jgi:hypothetical protein